MLLRPSMSKSATVCKDAQVYVESATAQLLKTVAVGSKIFQADVEVWVVANPEPNDVYAAFAAELKRAFHKPHYQRIWRQRHERGHSAHDPGALGRKPLTTSCMRGVEQRKKLQSSPIVRNHSRCRTNWLSLPWSK